MNERIKKIAEQYKGYYTLPFSWEGFEGDVIKLDAESLNILYQNYSNVDEYKFREKLRRYDSWFFDKPYNVTKNWLQHVIKWLEKEKQKK